MTLEDLLLSTYSDVCIMIGYNVVMKLNYRYSPYDYVCKELLSSQVERIEANDNTIRVWLKDEEAKDND